MRAAQIENGVVVNFAEVRGFDGNAFVDPIDSVIGSTWDGHAFTHPAPPLPTMADYVAAVQTMLDTKAQERRYYDILSASTYATSTNPTFKAEALACLAWRDAVWAQVYSVLDLVQTGRLAQPTIPELLAMLPTMEWPHA
jgi:hypothetical protein